jgi:hypothetical protein
VALTALVIAIGGVATAATGGLLNDGGQIIVFVADDDIVDESVAGSRPGSPTGIHAVGLYDK